MNAWTTRVQTLEWWSNATQDQRDADVLEDRIQDAWMELYAPHIWRDERGLR